jgi:hypothetical protein
LAGNDPRAIKDGSLAFIACFSRQSAGREVTYQYEELTLWSSSYGSAARVISGLFQSGSMTTISLT